MDILLKNATIIDESSEFHLKRKDILIRKGKIEKIGEDIKVSSVKHIDVDDLHVSKGWIDLNANFQDPGYEEKEDLESGMAAAAAGGFTSVVLSPSTFPVRDSKTQIEYLTNKSKNALVSILPYGSISKGQKGEELAELSDMHLSGSVGFTDGKKSIQNPNLMHRALLYAKAFNGLVISFPYQKEISPEGVMNEGISSTNLGLKGIPRLAEEMVVSRDLYLLEYTDSRLHFSSVSSPKSVELISSAKQKGQGVSCALPTYLLALNDSELSNFDSRWKTLPPLQDAETVKKLIAQLKAGKIDCLCSDHWPQDIESKMKEFDHAAFGIINLQTAFASANQVLFNDLDLSKIIHLFTSGPEKVLGLKKESIQEGNYADLTVFQPNKSFRFQEEDILSKSKNSPFIGKQLKGKIVGIINGKKNNLN